MNNQWISSKCNRRPRREYLLEMGLAEIEEKLTYT